MNEKTYELVCEECGKPFESVDEEATLCPECWGALISELGDGKDGGNS